MYIALGYIPQLGVESWSPYCTIASTVMTVIAFISCVWWYSDIHRHILLLSVVNRHKHLCINTIKHINQLHIKSNTVFLLKSWCKCNIYLPSQARTIPMTYNFTTVKVTNTIMSRHAKLQYSRYITKSPWTPLPTLHLWDKQHTKKIYIQCIPRRLEFEFSLVTMPEVHKFSKSIGATSKFYASEG
jgi:hypothetical protein